MVTCLPCCMADKFMMALVRIGMIGTQAINYNCAYIHMHQILCSMSTSFFKGNRTIYESLIMHQLVYLKDIMSLWKKKKKKKADRWMQQQGGGWMSWVTLHAQLAWKRINMRSVMPRDVEGQLLASRCLVWPTEVWPVNIQVIQKASFCMQFWLSLYMNYSLWNYYVWENRLNLY